MNKMRALTLSVPHHTPKITQISMDCLVCLVTPGVERYFMPCRCRVHVCDECIPRVTRCLYHRKVADPADASATIVRLVHLNLQLTDIAEDLRTTTRTLQASYERMRRCAITVCFVWGMLSIVKDAAFVQFGTQAGLFVSVASIFIAVAVLASFGLVLPWRALRRVNFNVWFILLMSVVLSKVVVPQMMRALYHTF